MIYVVIVLYFLISSRKNLAVLLFIPDILQELPMTSLYWLYIILGVFARYLNDCFYRNCTFYQLVNIYLFIFNYFETCFSHLSFLNIVSWSGVNWHLSFSSACLKNSLQIVRNLDSCWMLFCGFISVFICNVEMTN